jgi:UDP-N-acetyl-D-galactosamine dehydrogenase
LNFQPGLVGGHCIGVDPFYLAFQAQRHGYHPEVILSGRRVNDNMAERVAQECIKLLMKQGMRQGTRNDTFVVTILGVAFKEGVPDTRNSKVIDVVSNLRAVGITVQIHDPYADQGAVKAEYGLALTQFSDAVPADAVIVAVKHAEYLSGGWQLVQSLLIEGRGAVLDIKSTLERSSKPEGINLWRP